MEFAGARVGDISQRTRKVTQWLMLSVIFLTLYLWAMERFRFQNRKNQKGEITFHYLNDIVFLFLFFHPKISCLSVFLFFLSQGISF